MRTSSSLTSDWNAKYLLKTGLTSDFLHHLCCLSGLLWFKASQTSRVGNMLHASCFLRLLTSQQLTLSTIWNCAFLLNTVFDPLRRCLTLPSSRLWYSQSNPRPPLSVLNTFLCIALIPPTLRSSHPSFKPISPSASFPPSVVGYLFSSSPVIPPSSPPHLHSLVFFSPLVRGAGPARCNWVVLC